MISNIKEGLIVEQVLGAAQSNQLAGELSINLGLGYKVKNGKIIGRVKNKMLTGNIFAAFQNLVDIGNFLQLVSGGYCLPPILFKKLVAVTR
ncbi:MAG: metallopeptidase TldD-related protein [Cyanobacteria bacterium P01_H01_bin.35]